nr:hypothetical protein [Methanobacterium formicicum]
MRKKAAGEELIPELKPPETRSLEKELEKNVGHDGRVGAGPWKCWSPCSVNWQRKMFTWRVSG